MTFQKPGITCIYHYPFNFQRNKIHLSSYVKSKPFLRKSFVLSSYVTSKSLCAFQTWHKCITKIAWASLAPLSVIQVQKHVSAVL